MRKPATILLLIISLSLLFAGAVSAQEAPSVDVTVIDENGDNVTVACPGDEVAVYIEASANDEAIPGPMALINIDPESGLALDVDHAVMWDGTQWISNDDPVSGGFLTWSDQHEAWFWGIMMVIGPMQPGDVAELFIPAIVTDTGEITVDVIFEDSSMDGTFFPAEDSYTFLSVPCAAGETVPMQDTGAPIALAALGLLGILGGAVYGRLR
jgi:hypothetical protein